MERSLDGPADFAKIYNIPAGADGTGQSKHKVRSGRLNIKTSAIRTLSIE